MRTAEKGYNRTQQLKIMDKGENIGNRQRRTAEKGDRNMKRIVRKSGMHSAKEGLRNAPLQPGSKNDWRMVADYKGKRDDKKRVIGAPRIPECEHFRPQRVIVLSR